MAATGDKAAAMDSISRVAMAHPTALNLTGTTVPHDQSLEDVVEPLAPVPKKPSTNSELMWVQGSLASYPMTLGTLTYHKQATLA